MGEVPEFKHACKFCNKSFPCGRSLGGHMRSHLTNNSPEKTDPENLPSNKIMTKFNTETASSSGLEAAGYGLREKPKKTSRFADIISGPEETSSQHHQQLFDNKLFCCKDCGKSYQSWKALIGHMKSHSTDKEREGASLEEQDSSLNSANQVKLVMDSQSDNETAAPSRKKKKKRSQRRTRYNNMEIADNTNQNNASSSVSEIDQQEQEEVAMCLMMLSRDHGGGGGLKSVAESSDNFSEFSKSQTSRVTNTAEILRSKRESENFGSGNGKSWSGMNRTEVSSDGVLRKGKILLDQSGSEKLNSSKRNGYCDAKLSSDPGQIGRNSTKRSKFECATCNKTFNSYQALGGHRASHKKTKGCFASTIESSENSIETDEENKPRNHCVGHERLVDHDMPLPLALGENNESKSDQVNTIVTKKSRGHECPICHKVFPSGQALGGHKRSHLIAGGGGGGGSDAKTNTRPAATATVVAEKPISEIRDLLDLNLPAPDEEDSNGHVSNALEPWWAGSSHKHEALVGLISN